MIDIHTWMQDFLTALEETFAGRVYFVGLQGSYGRGEATERSDIDTVVILDELTPTDVQRYGSMLDKLPHRELTCGFLSGKGELLNWEPADLFQFYHDTTAIRGSLDELLPLLDEAAVQKAIRTAACNIYHGCVHNMLHEKSPDILRELYKSASFALQAIAYRETGRYFRRQSDLLAVLSQENHRIGETFLRYKNGEAVDFDEASHALFAWAKKWIAEA